MPEWKIGQIMIEKNLLEKMATLSLDKNLIQIVNFDTWSRIINGIRKSSILDHVYVNNLSTISDVAFETPVFGDHVPVVVNLTLTHNNSNETNALRKIGEIIQS